MHRILVVDRDPATRCALEGAGFETRGPSDVGKVLQMVRSWAPELVVLGMGDRGVSGLQLLRRIMDLDRKVLTVLVSDHSYADDFTSWLADAFVVRTADGSELKETVRRLLAESLRRGLAVREVPEPQSWSLSRCHERS